MLQLLTLMQCHNLNRHYNLTYDILIFLTNLVERPNSENCLRKLSQWNVRPLDWHWSCYSYDVWRSKSLLLRSLKINLFVKQQRSNNHQNWHFHSVFPVLSPVCGFITWPKNSGMLLKRHSSCSIGEPSIVSNPANRELKPKPMS